MVGNSVSDVGFTGTGCNRPIYVTGVVSRNIRASFTVLRTVARKETRVIPGEESIEATQDGDLEPLDGRLRW